MTQSAPDRQQVHNIAFNEHPLRRQMVSELHARPALPVAAPAQIVRFAFVTGGARPQEELEHLATLYAHYDKESPDSLPFHDITRLTGELTLRYERHTEFSSVSLIRFGPYDEPFAEDLNAYFPDGWLQKAPGKVIAAALIAIRSVSEGAFSIHDAAACFDGNPLVGAQIAGGKATHWTDINIHKDGFSRHIVELGSISASQAGRAVQRIVEIGTYRQLALLGLPEARRIGPDISDIEKHLTELSADMSRGHRDDEDLLSDLTQVAARLEHIQAETSWRFTASRAYHQLILDRLQELRQTRIEGLQNLSESLERRLTPAMRTCQAMDERQKDLAQRVYRLTGLLRARVDVERAEQNQRLLRSMDKSARQQLTLQKTVEGLSAVAISYYALGLVSYLAKAAKSAGLPIDPELATGIILLPLALLVWWGLRRATHKLLEKGDDT